MEKIHVGFVFDAKSVYIGFVMHTVSEFYVCGKGGMADVWNRGNDR